MPKEIKREVKTFEVKMMCDCGGEFLPTGFAQMSNPPKYGHQCSSCEKEVYLDYHYPKTVYEYLDLNDGK